MEEEEEEEKEKEEEQDEVKEKRRRRGKRATREVQSLIYHQRYTHKAASIREQGKTSYGTFRLASRLPRGGPTVHASFSKGHHQAALPPILEVI